MAWVRGVRRTENGDSSSATMRAMALVVASFSWRASSRAQTCAIASAAFTHTSSLGTTSASARPFRSAEAVARSTRFSCTSIDSAFSTFFFSVPLASAEPPCAAPLPANEPAVAAWPPAAARSTS